MFNSTRFKAFKKFFAVVVIASFATAPLALAHDPAEHGKENLSAGAEKTVTGEIVDMMCYVDHNAIGETHGQSCGAKCIKGGGPVGIVSDGKAYLVVGEHKPMNDQLAEFCGKTVTLKGKAADRGGIAMLENAEIVRK
jgi:hypothetical protein